MARRLRAEGHEVTGLVYRREAAAGEYRIDLSAPGGLAPLMDAKFDVVLHTAGVLDQDAPAQVHHRVNADGTLHVLRACPSWGVRHFVQFSSITVYGLRVMGEERSEARTPRTRVWLGLPYGKSKAAAERHVEASGVPYTTLRFPAVFGRDDSFVTRAMVPPLLAGTFDLAVGRDRKFTTMWVENVPPIVRELLLAGPQMRAYNAGDDQTTWSEFVRAYADALGVPVRTRSHRLWAAARNFDDKDFLFRFMNSRFGAHFPHDDLLRQFRPVFRPWRDGVREAVESFTADSGGPDSREIR